MRHESPERLALGLATGAAFGAVLQRSGVTRYDVITDQLLLRDHHVAKVMAGGAAAGAVGTETLRELGAAEPRIKPLQVPSIVLGGIAFGAGLALLGYCPGTSIAAAGEGRRDAMWGVLGMLAGAVLFVRLYPSMKPHLELPDLGKATLPSLTRTSQGPWVAGLAALAASALASRPRTWTTPCVREQELGAP